MIVSPHIVHKQKVDLKISRSEDSFSLQSRVSYILQYELPKKMETIFDMLASNDEIIRIDKLHLDLKTINSKNFENEFEDRFIEELQKELSKLKNNVSKNINLAVTNKQDSLLQSLIYFLGHGYLAWYDSVKQMQLWEEEIINNLSEKQWEYFLNWLNKNYKTNNQIIERLIRQFSDIFLQQVITKTNLYPANSIKTVYEDLLFILQTFSKQNKVEDRVFIWENTFRILLQEKRNDSDEYEILRNIFYKRDNLKTQLIESKRDEILGKIKTSAVQHAFEKLVQSFESYSNRETNGNLIVEENITQQEEIISKEKIKQQQIDEDALFVQNCGIVILCPFLEMYFTELELMLNKQFINDEACKRSVLLLHYLATGESQTAEFNLVLQKILCCLSIEETLPATIELSEKEVNESEKLLHAATEYWAPLKNTSIAGLQQTFLQRDGKLTQTEDGWLLRIEQKTVDILLGKLPWGFSTIQLPWMKKFLSVEWC